MMRLKFKLRFLMPVLIFSTMPVIAEEAHRYIEANTIITKDRDEKDSKVRGLDRLNVDMLAGYEKGYVYMKAGWKMQQDVFDFAGTIGVQDSYFKNHPIQFGSTIEAYYHIKFIKPHVFEQNIFAAASYYADLKPSDTRLTVYFGAGLKGNYLAVDAHNPPQWNVYPIISVFITQKFSNFLTLNAGLRTFSYFFSTAFIQPQFFANIAINLTPQFSLCTGIEGIYNSYRHLGDLKSNPETLKLQTINFNAGIKYSF